MVDYRFAALLLAAAATPALAQTAATSPEGSSFTGLRGEVFGGYNATVGEYNAGPASPIVSQHRHDYGGEAGLQAGYDYGFGRFVVGPFGSVALMTSDCDHNQGMPLCVRPQMELEGGLRAGAKMMNDRALVYVKGAYVGTRFHFTDISTGPNAGLSDDSWHGGWRAGAGVEYALNPHLYVKAEYDYTRTHRFGLGQYGEGDTSLRDVRNSVLAGVGVRF